MKAVHNESGEEVKRIFQNAKAAAETEIYPKRYVTCPFCSVRIIDRNMGRHNVRCHTKAVQQAVPANEAANSTALAREPQAVKQTSPTNMTAVAQEPQAVEQAKPDNTNAMAQEPQAVEQAAPADEATLPAHAADEGPSLTQKRDCPKCSSYVVDLHRHMHDAHVMSKQEVARLLAEDDTHRKHMKLTYKSTRVTADLAKLSDIKEDGFYLGKGFVSIPTVVKYLRQLGVKVIMDCQLPKPKEVSVQRRLVNDGASGHDVFTQEWLALMDQNSMPTITPAGALVPTALNPAFLPPMQTGLDPVSLPAMPLVSSDSSPQDTTVPAADHRKKPCTPGTAPKRKMPLESTEDTIGAAPSSSPSPRKRGRMQSPVPSTSGTQRRPTVKAVKLNARVLNGSDSVTESEDEGSAVAALQSECQSDSESSDDEWKPEEEADSGSDYDNEDDTIMSPESYRGDTYRGQTLVGQMRQMRWESGLSNQVPWKPDDGSDIAYYMSRGKRRRPEKEFNKYHNQNVGYVAKLFHFAQSTQQGFSLSAPDINALNKDIVSKYFRRLSSDLYGSGRGFGLQPSAVKNELRAVKKFFVEMRKKYDSEDNEELRKKFRRMADDMDDLIDQNQRDVMKSNTQRKVEKGRDGITFHPYYRHLAYTNDAIEGRLRKLLADARANKGMMKSKKPIKTTNLKDQQFLSDYLVTMIQIKHCQRPSVAEGLTIGEFNKAL